MLAASAVGWRSLARISVANHAGVPSMRAGVVVSTRSVSYKRRVKRAQTMNATDQTRKQNKLLQEQATKVQRETGKSDEVRGQAQKSLNMIIEDYIPDAAVPAPWTTKQGWNDRYWKLRRWGTSFWSKYIVLYTKLKGFDSAQTAVECQDIYRVINEAIPGNNKNIISEHTTNMMNSILRGQFEQTHSSGYKITWKMNNVLEPPKIHHARAFAMTTQTNFWAQIVVKLVTEQTVCIYDRNGKIVFGHPTEQKRVVEYPCFERHITEPDSKWRMCAKLDFDHPDRVNGLVPQDPVVQAAMEGKSVEEQNEILKKSREAAQAKL